MNETHSVPPGTRITLTMPDDFHHHFRDGTKTQRVALHASRRFARCIAMPNLKPPIVNTAMALEYRKHILNSLPDKGGEGGADSSMEPLMTLYLTDHTTPEEITQAHSTTHIPAAKYYPAGATTNSEFGVTSITKIYPALQQMSDLGMMLCIHSEVSNSEVDIFDRESVFIEEVMKPLVRDFPKLKIVMEHISTKDAVEYVRNAPETVKATITCHHLLYNRNDLLVGGIKPHYYCLPILKRETHRQALLTAATSSNPKFFLGTDSAPHSISNKECSSGCAGVYTAHAAIELYAEAFETMGALEKLEDFASHYGADHYGLKRNKRTIVLEKKDWVVPEWYEFGEEKLKPLRSGERVLWSIVD